MKFVICSDQPFCIVESEDFRDIILGIHPSNYPLELPGRNKMKDLISERYKLMREVLQEEIKTSDSRLNFVIDCWSSANGHSFQGVIVSWISNDWEIKTAVLDLTRVIGVHSGENLADHFIEVLDNFGIYDKLLTITTDNAGNMGTLFKHVDSIVQQRNQHQSPTGSDPQAQGNYFMIYRGVHSVVPFTYHILIFEYAFFLQKQNQLSLFQS